MTMSAVQRLVPWASFAELSTKHGRKVPQRPTTKVRLFPTTARPGPARPSPARRDGALPSAALQKLLELVIPRLVENVRKEPERQVVMGILETMNSVIKSCKEQVFVNPEYLREVSMVIHDVLKKKVQIAGTRGRFSMKGYGIC